MENATKIYILCYFLLTHLIFNTYKTGVGGGNGFTWTQFLCWMI